MSDQGQLFDPPEPEQKPLHPGQRSFPDWLKQPETVYHASFHKNWENDSVNHVGSQIAASDRLVQQATAISPHSEDDPRGGRIWARRLTEQPTFSASDSNLNTAQYAMNSPHGHYALEGATPENRLEMQGTIDALQAGHPVGYRNSFEDIGSTSALAPHGTLRAWHQDVQEAIDQGLPVHSHDVALAKQQFDPAIAITPEKGSFKAESYGNRYHENGAPQQLSMFPANVGDKLFETRPGDKDTDWQSSNRRFPGMDARNRAREFADSTGGTVGFGVHEHRTNSAPLEGVERVERANPTAMDAKRKARNGG